MRVEPMHEFEGLPIHERPVVLFDFDGTVADTQPAIMRTVGTVLSNLGYELSEEQMLPLIGPPLEIGIKLVTDMGEQEAQVVAAEYRALFERTVTPAEVADTHPAVMRTVGTVLSNHGYALSEEQMLPLIGPPLEIGIKLVTDMGEQEVQVVAAEYRALFERTVTPADIPLFPHTADLLDALAALGKRLAVATSRVEAPTCKLLDSLGVTQFEAVAALGRRLAVATSRVEAPTCKLLDSLGVSQFEAVAGRIPGFRETKAESIAAALDALGATCPGCD